MSCCVTHRCMHRITNNTRVKSAFFSLFLSLFLYVEVPRFFPFSFLFPLSPLDARLVFEQSRGTTFTGKYARRGMLLQRYAWSRFFVSLECRDRSRECFDPSVRSFASVIGDHLRPLVNGTVVGETLPFSFTPRLLKGLLSSTIWLWFTDERNFQHKNTEILCGVA